MTRARHSHLPPRAARVAALRRIVGSTSLRLGLAATVAVVLLVAQTSTGSAAASATGGFLEFFAGVICLLALTATVIAGLVATDRVVLLVRHRVLAQVVHRTVALAALGFLAVHVLAKVVEGHADLVDAVVPLLATQRTFAVGLGTMAGYGLVLAGLTGVLRGRFAVGSRPRLWRVVHATAYLSWVGAIVHGLRSGRPPAGWVSASYWICVGLVAVAVGIRVAQRWERRLGGRRGPAALRLRTARSAARGPDGLSGPDVAGSRPPVTPTLPGELLSDEEFWSVLREGTRR